MKKLLSILFFGLSVNAFASPIYEGIVRTPNCSGALLQFNGASPLKKAIVVTNGHCTRRTPVGEAVINRPEPIEAFVFDDQKRLFPLPLRKIIYTTMTETDVAFYEASMTYQEIFDRYKIEPFILDDQWAPIRTGITIVSGFWKEVTRCEIEEIVPYLREAGWTWKNSMRYTKACHTRGGFSGAPMVVNNTRIVVGIHNTGDKGRVDCSEGNPCELDAQGRQIFKEPYRHYGQQLSQFYGCLDRAYNFNFSLATCRVPKPRGRVMVR